jgi:hypothetical protein
MMRDLKSRAISLAKLKEPHSRGYSDDTEFVPLKFAEKNLGEYAEANKLLLEENAKWAKELELAHIKIAEFTKKP